MQTYQVKIVLKYSKPSIWRRVIVPSDILLKYFHEVIQIAMGWEDEHLHQFIHHNHYYSPENEDNDFWDDEKDIDYKKVRLSDLLQKEKDKIIYEYDFGDSWNHTITLEKITPGDETLVSPVCLAGKMHCPPEDSGGVWGYADMLEELKNPDKSEDDDLQEWLGDDFDPSYFNIEEVNNILKSIKFRKRKIQK